MNLLTTGRLAGTRVIIAALFASLVWVAPGLTTAASAHENARPGGGCGAPPPASASTASPASSAVTASPVGTLGARDGSSVAAMPTLRLGSRGEAVVTLQQRLTALRYDTGPIDGIFGDSTLHGVYAFQKVQRIAIDGIVGPITWGRLAAPYVPGPRFRHTGSAVEVDLGLRVLYLTRAGTITRILDASPGKPSTPTPVGNFSIYRRIDGWRQSDLGLLWRPNYFYGGYAIHGSTSVPTYAASHGCVRTTIAAMNRAWSQLYIGMPVHTYR